MESLPGPVPDVQDVNQLLFFDDAVDYPINVRFVAVKEVPDCFFSRVLRDTGLAVLPD